MTLRDLLNDAIRWEEPKLAYAIYWASMNGISLDEDFETLKTLKIDFQAVEGLVAENPLGVALIKLYSCKESNNSFHLVLAKNEKDVRSELFKRFGRLPNDIHDVSHGMDRLLDAGKLKTLWIRDIKDSAIEFPHYIGIYEKD